MGWCLLRLSAKILALLRLSVNLFFISSRSLDKGEAVSEKSFFGPSGRKEYL